MSSSERQRAAATIEKTRARVKATFPVSLLSRLQTRMTHPSLRIAARPSPASAEQPGAAANNSAAVSAETEIAAYPLERAGATPSAEEPNGASARFCRVASGASAPLSDIPDAVDLCKTLEEFGQVCQGCDGGNNCSSGSSAPGVFPSSPEVLDIFGLCDVVSRGVLDRCEDLAAPDEGLAELGELVLRAKEAASAMLSERSKSFGRRLSQGRRISKDSASLGTKAGLDLIKFASDHGLATSEEVYVSRKCLADRASSLWAAKLLQQLSAPRELL